MKVAGNVECPISGRGHYRLDSGEFAGVTVEQHAGVDQVWFRRVGGENN